MIAVEQVAAESNEDAAVEMNDIGIREAESAAAELGWGDVTEVPATILASPMSQWSNAVIIANIRDSRATPNKPHNTVHREGP